MVRDEGTLVRNNPRMFVFFVNRGRAFIFRTFFFYVQKAVLEHQLKTSPMGKNTNLSPLGILVRVRSRD